MSDNEAPPASVDPIDPLVGQTLHGTYVIEKQLGAGGMGAVYSSRHLRLPRRFAIKVLHAQMAANRDVFARFRQEAEITSALKHQHIVEVVDFNQLDNGMPYLVMEYLEGEDLYALLQRQRRLPLGEALELARQVGSALQAAHDRGVVHRDLKPQNIFLVRQQELGHTLSIAKVVDFGISKIKNPDAGTPGMTTDGTLLGTPSYMSPEQAAGRVGQIDGRTDQYALATILYEMLSGRVAFQQESDEGLTGVLIRVVTQPAPPLGQLCPELPERVLSVIDRAMSKNPAQRFASVTEMLAELGAAAEIEGKDAQAASVKPASVKPAGGSVAPGGVVPSGLTYTGQPSLISTGPAPETRTGAAFGMGPAVAQQHSTSLPVPMSMGPPSSISNTPPIGGGIKPGMEMNMGRYILWAVVIGMLVFLGFGIVGWRLFFH